MLHNRLMPAFVIMLATITLVGCHDPTGVPNDAHAATSYTTYCTVMSGMEMTGYIERWQTLPDDSYYWDPGTITVGYTAGVGGKDWPRDNGACLFRIPPFNCSGGVPACTLYYYQNSHEEPGEDQALLVNWWNANIIWPPDHSYDNLSTTWEAIWNSTCTLAVDVIHADDGWQKVPLETLACGTIGDSGAWYYQHDPTGAAIFKTGWVYPGSVSGGYTHIAGYDDNNNRQPIIKVVYDGP